MNEELVKGFSTIEREALERFVTEAAGIVGENSKEADDHTGELRIYTEDQISSAKKQIFKSYVLAAERKSERDVESLVVESVSQMNEKFAENFRQSYCDKITQICKSISHFEERLYGQKREESDTEIQSYIRRMFDYTF